MEKIQDQERLATLIHQWNQDHYDIFELSRPNEVKNLLITPCFNAFYCLNYKELLESIILPMNKLDAVHMGFDR